MESVNVSLGIFENAEGGIKLSYSIMPDVVFIMILQKMKPIFLPLFL